jgi:hypothetical protein
MLIAFYLFRLRFDVYVVTSFYIITVILRPDLPHLLLILRLSNSPLVNLRQGGFQVLFLFFMIQFLINQHPFVSERLFALEFRSGFLGGVCFSRGLLGCLFEVAFSDLFQAGESSFDCFSVR